MLSKNGDTRTNLFVTREYIQKYLTKYFESNTDPLSVYVTKVTVDPLHRVDKEVSLEKITKIKGVDMKHLYDTHHGHHHHTTHST